MQAFVALTAKHDPNGGITLPEDIYDNMGKISVQLNRHMEELKSTPMRGVMLGDITVGYGSKTIDLPLLDPDSKVANIVGSALLESQDTGQPLNEIMKSREGDVIAAFMLQVKQDDSGEPVSEHPEDPALDAKIKIKSKKTTSLESLQSELADAAGFSVVSDSFGISRGLVNFGDDEIVLKDALEKIADGFHYNWDKRSSILEFRDRNWFRKRNAQIPQAWVDGWKKTLKDTGTLDIGDLAQIAILTQEQLNVNVLSDDDLMRSGLNGAIYPHRDWLRAYAGLTEAQRTAVFSKAGLDLSLLTADQWVQVAKLITRHNGAYLEDADTHLILIGTRTPKATLFEYSFSITASEDIPPIKWSLATPKYQEPPTEQPKTEPDKPNATQEPKS
jgi:hypothetical protein